MARRITITLPEELLAFLDNSVANGTATSRSEAVTSALEQERRRELVERDVAILSSAGSANELDAFTWPGRPFTDADVQRWRDADQR